MTAKCSKQFLGALRLSGPLGVIASEHIVSQRDQIKKLGDEVPKLEQTMRNQQLEINRLRMRNAELESR